MKSLLRAISAIATRIQLEHVLSTGAVGFAAAAGVFGFTTRAGEIAFGFAILHLALSTIVASKRPPAWLRTAATDVEKALDGATGLIPLLTAVRAVAGARSAPVWLLTVLDDLITAAPLAGGSTLGPAVSGLTSRTAFVETPSGPMTISGIWTPEEVAALTRAWLPEPVGPSTFGPEITGFPAHA